MDTQRAARNIPLLYAIRLFFWMHFFSAVLVPFFREWGGISYSRIFFLNSWFMVWNFLLEVPTGTVADFFGRRISLAIGPLVAALGAVVYSSTPNFAVFLAAEVLFATAYTLMSGADEALAYDSLKALGREESAKRVLANLESWKLAGIVTGALLGSLIAAGWGVRAPMLFQALPSALCFPLALALFEIPSATPHPNRASYGELLRGGLRYFHGHQELRGLCFDMVSVGALTWMVIWLYQPALERSGIDRAWYGTMHATLTVVQIVVLSRVETIESWLGSVERYLQFSAVLPAVCFVVAAVSTNPVVTIVALLLVAAFGLSRGPVIGARMNAHIPSEQRATVLSVVSMIRTITIAASNLVVGALADRSIAVALGVVGVALLGISLGTWRARPTATP